MTLYERLFTVDGYYRSGYDPSLSAEAAQLPRSRHCCLCITRWMTGIHLVNIPAVGYDLVDRKPVGWKESTSTQEGGSFTLHAIAGNTPADENTTNLKWRV